LSVAGWPSLRELIIHDNPLTTSRSCDVSDIEQYLHQKLGILVLGFVHLLVDISLIIIMIIIIIPRQCLWCCHHGRAIARVSSPGSFDECRTAPSGRRPKTKQEDTAPYV